MQQDDVRGRIKQFLAPQLGGRALADSDDIFALGYVNSLFAMQLAVFVQQEFSFQLTPDDLEFDNFRTVDGLVGLVMSKTATPA
ncbi:acyl carrier protein [Streptomyces sp. NPDC003006]